jgi:hypothetical protein
MTRTFRRGLVRTGGACASEELVLDSQLGNFNSTGAEGLRLILLE